MKADLSHLNQYRFVQQEIRFSGFTGHPNFGIFIIPSIQDRKPIKVIFSRGAYGWDHVSMSKQKHTPSWNEMCWLKGLFFDDEETVMQLHPPKSEWISNHDNCLHLWRPIDQTIPMPPSMLVGLKDVGSDQIQKMTNEQRLAIVDKVLAEKISTTSRNVSPSDILQTIQSVTQGKVDSVDRQSLIDALQFLVPPKGSDYKQARSRVHRTGYSPAVERHYETTISDESHHMKGDTDRMPAELLAYQKQARRNFLARYRDEEDRDDPYNQMLEDEQAFADRDRE